MPAGMLPRPLLTGSYEFDSNIGLEELMRIKKARKTAFIPEKLFLSLRPKLSENTLTEAISLNLENLKDKVPKTSGDTLVSLAHNRIDRLTARTPEEGGLYFNNTVFFNSNAQMQLFMATSEPCLEQLSTLFGYVGVNGFGADASSGAGHIHFRVEEENLLFEYPGADAMSLSHGVLSENMSNPLYRQHVHFGKLGGYFAQGNVSPFKYPILMVRPGATFRPVDGGPFGALLEGLHHDPSMGLIRHHALHLPIGFTEEKR
jgi:CRISPR-associated protein Csm4